jgi:hypothetical protein
MRVVGAWVVRQLAHTKQRRTDGGLGMADKRTKAVSQTGKRLPTASFRFMMPYTSRQILGAFDLRSQQVRIHQKKHNSFSLHSCVWWWGWACRWRRRGRWRRRWRPLSHLPKLAFALLEVLSVLGAATFAEILLILFYVFTCLCCPLLMLCILVLFFRSLFALTDLRFSEFFSIPVILVFLILIQIISLLLFFSRWFLFLFRPFIIRSIIIIK